MWHHLSVVWNNDSNYNNRSLKLFYNGVLKKTIAYNTTPVLPSTVDFYFTVYKFGVNRNTLKPFYGKMTYIGLYDFAQNDADVSNLYNYNVDISCSIHNDCSNCEQGDLSSNHIFLPIYLDNNKNVLDNSVNAVETFDASYNFLMKANYATANNFRNFIKYKKINNNYVFSFSNTHKLLFENQLRNDILNSSLQLYNNGTFITSTDQKGNLGRMFIRYIADV